MASSSSTLLSSCPVLLVQYRFLKSATEGLSKADYKLFCHLLVSTIFRYRQVQENGKGWLSVPKRFIQDKFRTSNPDRLQRHGLIDIDRRYLAGKRPRRYRIKEWVLDGYVEASRQADNTDRRLLNIVTGKPLPTHSPELPNDPSMPPLIRLSIARLRVCYFDRPGILEQSSRKFTFCEQWIEVFAKCEYNAIMRVITKSHIRQATIRFPGAEKALESWYQLIRENDFNNFSELKQVFGSADQVGRIVVFDIKGNHYRLIAAIHYNKKTVYLLEVMDHAEYDKGHWKKKFKIHD